MYLQHAHMPIAKTCRNSHKIVFQKLLTVNYVTMTMTNNNAMHTSVLNGNIQTNDMIPTVSNVSEQESGSSRKQRHSSFQKNQIVFYKKNGKKSKAIIRSVHFDDELVPYYTIELDGREKQLSLIHISEPTRRS